MPLNAMITRTLLAVTLALAAADPAHVKDVEAWRAKHEADYRREWVTIDGLFFLKAGENRAGSARTNDIVLSPSLPATIGSFVLTGHSVRFAPRPGVEILRKNGPVSAPIDLKSDG